MSCSAKGGRSKSATASSSCSLQQRVGASVVSDTFAVGERHQISCSQQGMTVFGHVCRRDLQLLHERSAAYSKKSNESMKTLCARSVVRRLLPISADRSQNNSQRSATAVRPRTTTTKLPSTARQRRSRARGMRCREQRRSDGQALGSSG